MKLQLKIIKKLSIAETDGLKIGSSSLIFSPGGIKGGEYIFDIGTAGSIVLVFQAFLLSLLKTKYTITLRILTRSAEIKTKEKILLRSV